MKPNTHLGKNTKVLQYGECFFIGPISGALPLTVQLTFNEF